MKLGAAMGEMSKPNKGGATKEALCTSDADCSDNEICKNGNCINVCNPSPCPSDEFCLNEGNHSYSCVECTSNDQCPDREICKNNSCVDACTGNPCTSKNQACSSQNGHSYICYGCINDKGCPSGKICDVSSKTCIDASCPSGYSTSVTSCGTGYTLSKNGSVGGKPCGKCVSTGDPCKTQFGTYYVASTTRTCGSDAKLVKKTTSSGVACIGCIPCNCSAGYMAAWNEAESFYHLPGDPNCHGATSPSVGTIMDYALEGEGKNCDGRPCWKCVQGCPTGCKNKYKNETCPIGQAERPCNSALTFGNSFCFTCGY